MSKNTHLSTLPFTYDFDTVAILKMLTKAHKALAELKGSEDILPNKSILISALSLQEAKDSSEIENIITTHDELYRSNYISGQFTSAAAKEVYAYKDALLK
jgi:Fic family protein